MLKKGFFLARVYASLYSIKPNKLFFGMQLDRHIQFLILWSCYVTVEFELQMWMNVLKALVIAVMIMQLATIFMEITPALAILDTQAMDLCVLVSSFIVFLVN